jgi:long-chain acyl-CoA synthetase
VPVAEVLALADAAGAAGPAGPALPVEGGDPAVAVPALVGALRAGRTPLVLPFGTGPKAAAELVAAVAAAARAAGHAPGEVLALPTSGTTSAPRGVLRTIASWDAALDPFTQLAGTGPGDLGWAPGAAASTLTLWALWHALSTGVPVVTTGPWRGVPAGPEVSALLDRVTVLHAVPAVLADVLQARSAGKLPSLRTAVVAGAAPPAALCRRAAEAGVRLVEYYGATELSFVAADPDGAGLRPFPGAAVRVREGLVEVRSPYLSLGYVLPPGAQPGPWYRDSDGWAGVGDRGRFVAGGVLEVAGRGGEALSVGGHVVLAADVERVLGGVDGVLEVVCVGAPDERLGQLPCAVVRAADGPDGRAELLHRLRTAASADLPPVARPRRHLFLDELPRTAGGKPDLRRLVELLDHPGGTGGCTGRPGAELT